MSIDYLRDRVKNVVDGRFRVLISSNEVFNCEHQAFVPELYYHDPRTERGKEEVKQELIIFEPTRPFLLIRVPTWLFGVNGLSIIEKVVSWDSGDPIPLSIKWVGTPTYTEDAFLIINHLINKRATGIYHIANAGNTTEFHWGKYVADKLGKPEAVTILTPDEKSDYVHPLLDIEKVIKDVGFGIPKWTNAVDRYLEELNV